jgi:SOS response regulatory protein OraA/RecX
MINKMGNILKETKITKNDFIELILDELINSDTINDEEYELAYVKTNLNLIQKYCKNNIKQVLKNLSNIDDMELDEIIYLFGFDVKGFINEIKN